MPGTTADIRPVKKTSPSASPPATSPAPAAASPAKTAAVTSLQLSTVTDLENVSPRVLDQEPPDAGKLTARLKEEIQDIANKSGAKRPEIIAAWKKSQLYQAYVEMGNDSMQQGKSISEVAVLRKTSGKPYLTEEQFHAVSDISRQLLS